MKKIIIIVLSVMVLAVASAWVFLYVNKQKSVVSQPQALEKTEVKTPEQPALSKKITSRIVYKNKDNEIISVDGSGANPINLSKLGVPTEQFFGVTKMIVSGDGKILYFFMNNNLWRINTDGSDLKKITNNSLNQENIDQALEAVNYSGDIAYFSYKPVDSMDQEIVVDPKIHGFYVYNKKSEFINFITEKGFWFGNEDTKDSGKYEFIGFIGDQLLYAKHYFGEVDVKKVDCDDCLFQLNAPQKSFSKFSSIKFPDLWFGESFGAFVDEENERIVYHTIGDHESQILSVNYKNGEKIAITPLADFATYQFLSVSPEAKNLVYMKEDRRGSNPNPYYASVLAYNFDKKETKIIAEGDIVNHEFKNIYTNKVIWLDEQNLIVNDYNVEDMNNFNNSGNLYKINLNDFTKKLFISGVKYLVPNHN